MQRNRNRNVLGRVAAIPNHNTHIRAAALIRDTGDKHIPIVCGRGIEPGWYTTCRYQSIRRLTPGNPSDGDIAKRTKRTIPQPRTAVADRVEIRF